MLLTITMKTLTALGSFVGTTCRCFRLLGNFVPHSSLLHAVLGDLREEIVCVPIVRPDIRSVDLLGQIAVRVVGVAGLTAVGARVVGRVRHHRNGARPIADIRRSQEGIAARDRRPALYRY
jgi:hypothetical protein